MESRVCTNNNVARCPLRRRGLPQPEAQPEVAVVRRPRGNWGPYTQATRIVRRWKTRKMREKFNITIDAWPGAPCTETNTTA